MIPGIVLAAGKSSRMGRPKALLPLGSDTFLSRVIRTLRTGGGDDVIVVAGADVASVRQAVDGDRVAARVVENPNYEQGQLSSLLAGLRAIDRPGVNAALVTLIDVPLVSPSTVATLIKEYSTG